MLKWKIFYYMKIKKNIGVENINKINLLKDSNIEWFKRLFQSQINYANIDIKKEIDKRIQYILLTLDNFFDSNFSKKTMNQKK